jgi:hypothetical protein
MLEISWFVQCVTETSTKSFQIFTTDYTCDITTTGQLEEVYDPKDLKILEQLGIEHEENLDIPANPHDDPDYF